MDTTARQGRAAIGYAVALWLGMLGRDVAAAQASPYSLREGLSVATMVSSDQVTRLKYDSVGLRANASLSRAMSSWLELAAGAQYAAFLSSRKPAGGALSFTVGSLFRAEKKTLSPYLALDLGAAITGPLVRPYFSMSVGLDAQIAGRLRLGPLVTYAQIVEPRGPLNTTDARFISFGISLRQQLGAMPVVSAPEAQPARQLVVESRAPEEERAAPSEDVVALIERALPSSTRSVQLLAPILFETGSDELDQHAVAALHEVRRILASETELRSIEIEGYADGRGASQNNLTLSRRRAERVRSWLIGHGIAPERLTIAAYGSTAFVEQGADDRAQQQNRRVVFRVTQTGAEP